MELRTLRSFPGKWSDQFGDTMKMLHGDNLRRTYLEDECTLQLGTPRTACECTTLTQKTICLFVCLLCSVLFIDTTIGNNSAVTVPCSVAEALGAC